MGRFTGPLLAGVVVVAALLLGTSIVPAQLGPTLEPNDRVAVGVNVLAQPSSDATIRAVLRPGDRAIQIGEVANWYNVRLSDGTEGWAFKAFLRVVATNAPASAPATAAGASTFRVHLIDVGQGAATLLEFP